MYAVLRKCCNPGVYGVYKLERYLFLKDFGFIVSF